VSARPESALVDVFVQRRFDAADTRGRERPDSARLEPCLDLHGIRCEQSYLARDGQRILCHFRAPDAESLRIALRVSGIDYDALWTGAVSHFAGAASLVLVVERTFERALTSEQERACRAALARQLLALGVKPARVLLSRSRKRLLWLCRAETPETLAAAESGLAGQGFEVWSCEAVPMEKMT
jgi:hypothetical protein